MLEILLTETLIGTEWLPIGSICDRFQDYYHDTFDQVLLCRMFKYVYKQLRK